MWDKTEIVLESYRDGSPKFLSRLSSELELSSSKFVHSKKVCPISKSLSHFLSHFCPIKFCPIQNVGKNWNRWDKSQKKCLFWTFVPYLWQKKVFLHFDHSGNFGYHIWTSLRLWRVSLRIRIISDFSLAQYFCCIVVKKCHYCLIRLTLNDFM